MDNSFDHDAFMDKAIELFRRNGILNVSLEEIAKQANISMDIVCKEYASVATLVGQIAERENAAIAQIHIECLDSPGRPDVRLTRLVKEAMVRLAKGYVLELFNTAGRINNPEEHAVMMNNIPPNMLDYRRQNTAAIARIIAQGQADGTFSQFDPMEGAFLLRGMLHASMFYRETPYASEEDAANYAECVIRLFFKGIYR